jgi:hypothetical protein
MKPLVHAKAGSTVAKPHCDEKQRTAALFVLARRAKAGNCNPRFHSAVDAGIFGPRPCSTAFTTDEASELCGGFPLQCADTKAGLVPSIV